MFKGLDLQQCEDRQISKLSILLVLRAQLLLNLQITVIKLVQTRRSDVQIIPIRKSLTSLRCFLEPMH